MSHEKLTYEDLVQIIELVKSSERWSEFHLKVGDLEVDFKRAPVAAPAAPPAPPAEVVPAHQRSRHVGGGEVVNDAPPATPQGSRRASPTGYSPNAALVKSPMVGTFYRAPEPGAPPFVDVGHEVDTDTIVCIIEVMKLMNSIPAAGRGVVAQILVADGEPVEYGQVLMVIEPKR